MSGTWNPLVTGTRTPVMSGTVTTVLSGTGTPVVSTTGASVVSKTGTEKQSGTETRTEEVLSADRTGSPNAEPSEGACSLRVWGRPDAHPTSWAFSPFGNIIDLSMDPPRKCAFVTYEKMESADQAVAELNGTQVESVQLKVGIARRQPMLDAATGSLCGAPLRSRAVLRMAAGTKGPRLSTVMMATTKTLWMASRLQSWISCASSAPTLVSGKHQGGNTHTHTVDYNFLLLTREIHNGPFFPFYIL
uniref:Negative elongation factor E n=1 Tax=Molossus molossus TaxID=27622 RepID=A0A7J8ERC8_MOLMO|nr:hypothetical protein HJG59_008726 [Molossus molossus]